MSNAEFNPVPNCDYVHAQALELNDAHDQLVRLRARQAEDALRLMDDERGLASMTRELSDDMFRREFLQEGEDDALQAIHTRLLNVGWRHYQQSYDYHSSALELDSPHGQLIAHYQKRQDSTMARMDQHTARWHARGNEACYLSEDWEPPIRTLTASMRIAAQLLLQKAGLK